jgi:competence protein ComEC
MESRSLFALFFCFGLGASAAFGLFRILGDQPTDLRVWIWDVGQGDAIWIRFPNGASWVLDTAGKRGGEQSVASQGPLPHLASRGVLKLDRLILSHPDLDHAFGALDWLQYWRVDKLSLHADWIEQRWQKPLLVEILQRAQKREVTIDPIGEIRREIVSMVSVRWIPLHFKKANDQALVLELEYGPCRLLFTGDIEQRAERALTALTGPTHVLKVAHHGSKTSSSLEFLRKTHPLFSIISVGTGNSYGHPHPAVLRRLAADGGNVLRTDRHGFVELSVSQKGMLHCRSASGFCGEVFCAN